MHKLEPLNPLTCWVSLNLGPSVVVSNGKPFPEVTVRCEIMGDLVQATEGQQEKTIICCPLCGESLPESPNGPIGHCLACEFNLELLVSPEKPHIPQTVPAYVPRLVYWLIGSQMVLSGIFAIAFLFLAAPLYLGTPQLIAAIQLLAIVALGLFAIFLYQKKGITIIRIGLMIVGVISLPPGVCAISAGLAISPLQRMCVICEKQIKWVAHIECPHCQVSMHRLGSCRNKRLQTVAASLDSEALLSQVEFTCPNCHQSMHPNHNRGKTNG